MRKVLEGCPSCGAALIVTEVQCGQCQTQVRSQYSLCSFCALTADQLVFVKLFVEKRGNLREVEKVLGISYPTVRGKLEEVAERLGAVPAEGPPPPPGQAAPDDLRGELRRLLAEGKLAPKEALARLRRAAGSESTAEAPAAGP